MNALPYAHAFQPTIGLDALETQVPAAFTDHAAAHTSRNYVFISTRELVSALLDAGFVATQARQSIARNVANAAYSRHMLSFQPQLQQVQLHDVVAQIILINSHDGRCSYQLRAGLYRPICTNGLLTRLGDFGLIHVPHRGNVVQNVVDAALQITRDFSRVGEVIEKMRSTALAFEQKVAFARQAIAIRYVGAQHQPFLPDALLRIRREADRGDDVWRVFNVVQENLIRGGIDGRSASGRATRSRGIRAIREDVRINNDLWQLAVGLMR